MNVLCHYFPERNGEGRWLNREKFALLLDQAIRAGGVKLGAPVKKAMLNAMSEKDEDADVCRDATGQIEPDADLRDFELVPLREDWREYVGREVTPFVPDAWVDTGYTDARDGDVGRVGYEINFNRYFYRYVPPRPLEEIDAELKTLEAEIAGLLKEVVG
jgi:type I restriction enzyme M protein